MIEVEDKCPRCGTKLKIQAEPALRDPDRELYLSAAPDDLLCPMCGTTLSLKVKLNAQVLADSRINPGTLVTYEQEQAQIIAKRRRDTVIVLAQYRSSDAATQRQLVEEALITARQLDGEAYATARLQAQKILEALIDDDGQSVPWISILIKDKAYPLNIMHTEVANIIYKALELLNQLPLDFEED